MGLRFTGARDNEGRPLEYIGWAPARDLTDAECAEIGEERIKALIASNLYEEDKPAKPVKAGAAAPEGEQ